MTVGYLVFLLGEKLFGARLSGAVEILPWRRSRAVPLSYSYVEGLLDYRGTIYPVFNLAQRLGMIRQGPIGFVAGEKDSPRTGRSIILLEENGVPFGIIADSVVKTARLEEAAAAVEQPQDIDPQFVKGLVFDDDQEITILDFERLFHAG
jgi:purine-binding chemotaxis protein CheW